MRIVWQSTMHTKVKEQGTDQTSLYYRQDICMCLVKRQDSHFAQKFLIFPRHFEKIHFFRSSQERVKGHLTAMVPTQVYLFRPNESTSLLYFFFDGLLMPQMASLIRHPPRFVPHTSAGLQTSESCGTNEL